MKLKSTLTRLAFIDSNEVTRMTEQGFLQKLHTSKIRGYISRKNLVGEVYLYEGKFGSGYAHIEPRFDSTQYCNITYYVRKEV